MDFDTTTLMSFVKELPKPWLVLSGAGISAESGIPTFRGEEGYWRVGSENYHPQEMATNAMFRRMPKEVWRWYLYRRALCRMASPNPGHLALVQLAAVVDLNVVTQNVDGLHLRAGQAAHQTFEIHGNIDYFRDGENPRANKWPIPSYFDDWTRERELTEQEMDRLRCPDTGTLGRPHVLWFDECYDEETYRFDTALGLAERCGTLLTIGTTGQTNLPVQMVRSVIAKGGHFVDINIAENDFGQLAERLPTGRALKGKAGEWLPKLVAELLPHMD